MKKTLNCAVNTEGGKEKEREEVREIETPKKLRASGA